MSALTMENVVEQPVVEQVEQPKVVETKVVKQPVVEAQAAPKKPILSFGSAATTPTAVGLPKETVAAIAVDDNAVVVHLNGVNIHVVQGPEAKEAVEKLMRVATNAGRLSVRIGAREHATEVVNPKVWYYISDLQVANSATAADVYEQLFGFPSQVAEALGKACGFGFWNHWTSQGLGQQALNFRWSGDKALPSAVERAAMIAVPPQRQATGGRR